MLVRVYSSVSSLRQGRPPPTVSARFSSTRLRMLDSSLDTSTSVFPLAGRWGMGGWGGTGARWSRAAGGVGECGSIGGGSCRRSWRRPCFCPYSRGPGSPASSSHPSHLPNALFVKLASGKCDGEFIPKQTFASVRKRPWVGLRRGGQVFRPRNRPPATYAVKCCRGLQGEGERDPRVCPALRSRA